MFRSALVTVVGLVGFAPLAFAQDLPTERDTYDVRVRSNGEQVGVWFRTNAQSDERCRLVVDAADVSVVNEDPDTGFIRHGLLEITTSVGECASSAGPDNGRAIVDTTELTAGRYVLIIDGTVEGRLRVSEEGRVAFKESDANDDGGEPL